MNRLARTEKRTGMSTSAELGWLQVWAAIIFVSGMLAIFYPSHYRAFVAIAVATSGAVAGTARRLQNRARRGELG